MNFIITIDTEEDDWGSFNTAGQSLRNIEQIPRLQSLFDEFKVRPTYVITYPVATEKTSLGILKRIAEDDKCEIGVHCHPWNTPPFREETTEYNSMLCNLPVNGQYEKIGTLRDVITKNFGTVPCSFRAGRWGYNEDVAKNLFNLGFKVDTSVSPLCDWSCYHGPDFTDASQAPYFVDIDNGSDTPAHRREQLIEIPASIGFLQKNQAICKSALQALQSQYLKHFRLTGVLYRLNLLNMVWLSPESHSSKEMIQLAKTFKALGHDFVNMTFHSTSLLPGKSPFVKDRHALEAFYEKIRAFLRFAAEDEILSFTLSEAADNFAGRQKRETFKNKQGEGRKNNE